MIRRKLALLLAVAIIMLPVMTSCSRSQPSAPAESNTATEKPQASEPVSTDKILKIASSDNPATLDPASFARDRNITSTEGL